MNKVILIGRLTKDPDIRYTTGENKMAVAKFMLAVNRKNKTDEKNNSDFIPCVAFKKNAEFVEKYLNKGMKIALEGHWTTGSYDNQEGKKVYTHDCVIEKMEFAESKKDNVNYIQNNNYVDIIDDDEDDLPF